MIGIVLAVLGGLGLLFALPATLTPIGTGIGESFMILARTVGYIAIIALPILAAIAPLYFVLKKENRNINLIVIGALYGLILYLVVVNFGLMSLALNYFGNITGTWLEEAGRIAVSVLLFLEGITLSVIDHVVFTVTHLRQALHGLKERAKRFNRHFT